VRVEPDDADVAPEAGHDADRAHAVPGEHERERAPADGRAHRLRHPPDDLEGGADLVRLAVPPADADELDVVPCARERLRRTGLHELFGAGAHARPFVAEVVRNQDERDPHA
jgi:hypothetical protein